MLDFLVWACQLPAHSAVPAPSLLCSDSCTLLSASWITVSNLFERVPKGFFVVCFFNFRVNEEKLIFLNFPKEASTRQKLRLFLFLLDLFLVNLLARAVSNILSVSTVFILCQ